MKQYDPKIIEAMRNILFDAQKYADLLEKTNYYNREEEAIKLLHYLEAAGCVIPEAKKPWEGWVCLKHRQVCGMQLRGEKYKRAMICPSGEVCTEDGEHEFIKVREVV